MWRRWYKNVHTSWEVWWKQHAQMIMQQAGAEIGELLFARGASACHHARLSNFWSWEHGSAIFFWRWPERYFWDIALGVPPNWIATPEVKITEQYNLGESATIAMMETKIAGIRCKGYISPGLCKATMNSFAVPKGDSDIQMVYDGTKSGLNDCLYAPWFPLPDAEILVNTLDEGFWCIDNNYEEMFLNFWLHPELIQYSRMDLTSLYGTRKKHKGLLLEVWTRGPMGQSPSPYAMIQQTRCLKWFIYDDCLDPLDVFRWDQIKLNLPGTLE
ncbi:hypothetical protein ACA910_018518 [Epithemia clementina (nom. ined.)]